MKQLFFSLALLGLLFAWSCKKSDDDKTSVNVNTVTLPVTITRTVSYVNDVAPILNQYCVGCHNTKNASEGISYSTYAETKITAANNELWSSVYSRKMPQDGKLSDTDLALIQKWIKDGYLDDTATASSGTSTSTVSVTYAKEIKPILDYYCVSCHVTGGASGGVSYSTYSETVSGNAGSKLYSSVSSDSMPKGATKLNATQKALIYNWVNSGKLNN